MQEETKNIKRFLRDLDMAILDAQQETGFGEVTVKLERKKMKTVHATICAGQSRLYIFTESDFYQALESRI